MTWPEVGKEALEPESARKVGDGMAIEINVAIAMDDGMELRADVFRPLDQGRHPVILSYGPYAKGLAFQEGYAPQWGKMAADHPDVLAGSTNRYQNWEVVDPEKWVPDGYAIVRVDSRGAGWSPGVVNVWSPREADDIHACIEWAAGQPWSSGKVGMSGISYYAMNQWQVAKKKPPHLAALVAWEGAGDFYRELAYHGGILSDFAGTWYERQVSSVQHGAGERAARSAVTGHSVAGPVTLSDTELRRNRRDLAADIKAHPLDDAWHRDRSGDFSTLEVPFLSAANWGGQGLHTRGNFEAFVSAPTTRKWLEVHGGSHWEPFYTDQGVDLQKRFLGHFLKGENNGWDREPPVRLNVRHADGRFTIRTEREWPLARTRWTAYHLDAGSLGLTTLAPEADRWAEYQATGEGLTFLTPPIETETEITGPIAARLFVSSTTNDADLFLAFRVFRPDGGEVVFQGALDPNTPIGLGWLRASHRRLDPERSLPHRPYHSHDRLEPLVPGEVYELEVEIWPTCIVAPAGHRLALTVRGRDYEYAGELDDFARTFHFASRGVGPFTHTDPDARPPDVYGGRVTVHTGGARPSRLLLPVIPAPGS